MKEKKEKFREYRAACSEAREYLAIRENIASLYDAERKENARASEIFSGVRTGTLFAFEK